MLLLHLSVVPILHIHLCFKYVLHITYIHSCDNMVIKITFFLKKKSWDSDVNPCFNTKNAWLCVTMVTQSTVLELFFKNIPELKTSPNTHWFCKDCVHTSHYTLKSSPTGFNKIAQCLKLYIYKSRRLKSMHDLPTSITRKILTSRSTLCTRNTDNNKTFKNFISRYCYSCKTEESFLSYISVEILSAMK